jgi:hypothetical protein
LQAAKVSAALAEEQELVAKLKRQIADTTRGTRKLVSTL